MIEVYVALITGKIISLKVEASNTIEHMKEKIKTSGSESRGQEEAVCTRISGLRDHYSESRRAVVSREAKKKQYARAFQAYATTTVSYLHGWSV